MEGRSLGITIIIYRIVYEQIWTDWKIATTEV